MILFHCWEEYSSKKTDLMGYSAHLDTINSLEWAERKGVNQAYYPNFTTSRILSCLSQSCTPCTPFFRFIFSTFSPPALSRVLPSSHPVYEWNMQWIRMALGMEAHQIAMGSYCLSFSLVILLPTLCPLASSGLMWVVHHARLSPLCPHVVFITTTLPPWPNLENCWYDIMSYFLQM